MRSARQTWLLLLTMTVLMGLVLSAVFTWQDRSLDAGFLEAWLSRFAGTYIIVLPTVIVISPIAQRLALYFDSKLGGQPAPVEVAKAAWQANAAGHAGRGFGTWLDHLADDVSIWMPLGQFRGENRGKDRATEICGAIASAAPDLVYEQPFRSSQNGQTVVFEFEDHGTIAGQPYRNRIAASFDIADGKVVQYREYFGDIDPAIVALMTNASLPTATHTEKA